MNIRVWVKKMNVLKIVIYHMPFQLTQIYVILIVHIIILKIHNKDNVWNNVENNNLKFKKKESIVLNNVMKLKNINIKKIIHVFLNVHNNSGIKINSNKFVSMNVMIYTINHTI